MNTSYHDRLTSLADPTILDPDNYEIDCPREWALYDTVTGAWLADESGVRIYRGHRAGSNLGKWACQLVADLLSICACPACKGRIEARPYDPDIIQVREDVKIPLGRDFCA